MQSMWMFTDPATGTPKKAQVAFQVRLKPESYSIGHETVHAAEPIDQHISNDSIEWYTRGDIAGSIIPTGLMVRVVDEDDEEEDEDGST